MLVGIDGQLGENVNLNDVLAATDLSELVGSEELKELLAGIGARELADKLEQLSKANEGSNQAADNRKAEPTEKANTPGQKVHEQLIDSDTIEKVRQSIIINATSMKGEL